MSPRPSWPRPGAAPPCAGACARPSSPRSLRFLAASRSTTRSLIASLAERRSAIAVCASASARLLPFAPSVADARALATFLRTPRARSWSKRSSFRLLLAMVSCCPARPRTNHDLDAGDHRAEVRDRGLQLRIRQVGRRPEPQPHAAAVGEHAALGERPLELAGARRAQREEAAEALQRNGALARDDLVGRAERVEARGQQVDLAAVGRAQALGRQALLARRTRTRAPRGSGSSGRTSSRRSARPRGRRGRATDRARRRARRTPRTTRSRRDAGRRRARAGAESSCPRRAAGTCSRPRPPTPRRARSSSRANGTLPSAW